MKIDSIATEEKIAEIAISSALDVDGVTAMSNEAEGLIPSILARDVIIREGVRLSRDKEGNRILDIYIRARYGSKIPQLAWVLQKKIQSDVKTKTKILLNEINIHVEGVDMGD